MSTEFRPWGETGTRRPLNSTRVRVPVVAELRLRRLTVAPLPEPKRLFSPITAPDDGGS